jgi:polygalacturonase
VQSHALQNPFPKSVFEFQTSIATIVQSHVLQSQEWWVGGFVCTISAVEAAITPASMMVICMTFAWSMQTESLWPLIPVLPSYGHGHELPGPRYSSLIHGQYLNDFIITGENGSIDGQGAWWWHQHKLQKLKYTRGHLIELLWSSNIEISNVTLRNSPFWTVHPYDCTNVTIHGVTILAPLNAPNTDGIDPGIHSSLFLLNYPHH